MKTLHFARKYPEINTHGTLNKQRGDEFIKDMAAELDAYLASTSPPMTIKKFNWAVNQVRSKWDSLFQRLGTPESFWKFFYASRVIMRRDELLGDLDAGKQTSQNHPSRR